MSLFLLLPGITSWEVVDVSDVVGPRQHPKTSGWFLDRPVAAPVSSTGQRPTSTETRNRE